MGGDRRRTAVDLSERHRMTDLTDTAILYDELAYDDVIPLMWQSLDARVDAVVAASFEDANLNLLHACSAMDEPHSLSREKQDESPLLAAELARLDFKLTLLLDLVAQLASRDLQRPAPTRVRFNALGATFLPARPLEVGTEGVLHLYLRPMLPRPLSFPSRVAGFDPEGRTRVRFHPLSDPVADLIEKLAFRRHRRHVAESRRPR
jgi:hypothetical protein